jgi:hypothetical protein
MFARDIQLVLGTGSGQELVDRIQADLLPIYRAAPGFLTYHVIAAGGEANDTFTTLRVFDSQAALEDANAAAEDASEQIRVDFGLTFTLQGEGDVVLFAQASDL